MSYNTLSGTVVLPGDEGRLLVEGIISGSNYIGDGANINNVPRVSNAANNALVTNVNGDANNLTCESNFTFDGTTAIITGHLTASLGVSASYFFGDGSGLTNLPGGAGGSSIFTALNGTTAYSTSSIQIGASSSPAVPLSVAGSSYLSGGVIHKRRVIATNQAVAATDYYLSVDSTAGAIRLTLPAASTLTDGQTWIVKDEGGAANSNNITVTGSSDSDLIDGANLVVLESPYASIAIYCNGVNKFFVW